MWSLLFGDEDTSSSEETVSSNKESPAIIMKDVSSGIVAMPTSTKITTVQTFGSNHAPSHHPTGFCQR